MGQKQEGIKTKTEKGKGTTGGARSLLLNLTNVA
jgi:hypothetical protein